MRRARRHSPQRLGNPPDDRAHHRRIPLPQQRVPTALVTLPTNQPGSCPPQRRGHTPECGCSTDRRPGLMNGEVVPLRGVRPAVAPHLVSSSWSAGASADSTTCLPRRAACAPTGEWFRLTTSKLTDTPSSSAGSFATTPKPKTPTGGDTSGINGVKTSGGRSTSRSTRTITSPFGYVAAPTQATASTWTPAHRRTPPAPDPREALLVEGLPLPVLHQLDRAHLRGQPRRQLLFVRMRRRPEPQRLADLLPVPLCARQVWRLLDSTARPAFTRTADFPDKSSSSQDP